MEKDLKVFTVVEDPIAMLDLLDKLAAHDVRWNTGHLANDPEIAKKGWAYLVFGDRYPGIMGGEAADHSPKDIQELTSRDFEQQDPDHFVEEVAAAYCQKKTLPYITAVETEEQAIAVCEKLEAETSLKWVSGESPVEGIKSLNEPDPISILMALMAGEKPKAPEVKAFSVGAKGASLSSSGDSDRTGIAWPLLSNEEFITRTKELFPL